MALINKLTNTASLLVDGVTTTTNAVETLLSLPPVVLKAVDSLIAKIGDTLTYTVTVTNVNLTALTDVQFSDVLPEGSTYTADSFTVNGAAVTPTVNGNTLQYTIPSIAIAGVATVQFQCEVIGGEI